MPNKPGQSHYTARINSDIKNDFDKAVIDNKTIGHTRDNVTEHFLQFYTQNGLPTFENVKDVE